MHAPLHLFCKIELKSPGVGHEWGTLRHSRYLGSRRAQIGDHAWKTQTDVLSRRCRYTWKASSCWSTLSEMIVSVNWLRHYAYQCGTDTMYVIEIRSSYCYPIKTPLNTQRAARSIQPCNEHAALIGFMYMKPLSNCLVDSGFGSCLHVAYVFYCIFW